jgi:hypothetical protein
MRHLALAIAVAVLAVPASAGAARFERLPGFKAPGTPAKYNKVGALQFGKRSAKNVLILNPGTSASAAYFAPLARMIVSKAPGWQVWAVERRENLLEDHSVLDRLKAGKATAKELFDYYLQWTTDSSVSPHFEFIPNDRVAFARKWGMRVEVEDLHRVVRHARKNGARRIVVGGPLARRVDHERLRNLELRRQGGGQGARRARVHRRRQRPGPEPHRGGGS